jgi:hypothetical protein
VQPSETAHRIFFFSFIFIFKISFFFKYETIFRSSGWSFGHSDPDPSSVQREGISLHLSLLLSCATYECTAFSPQSPLTPDQRQVKKPPPSLQITSNFLVFMGFHMLTLLKRSVWLKILYIQKSEELFLETVVFVKKT